MTKSIATMPLDLRSKIMRSIRKRDTQPELIVRRALHAAGLRFRLHRRGLPGTPDIVLPGRRLCVLVHGCFWHQHPGCAKARQPRTNQAYWGPKLARNAERDAATCDALRAAGWDVLVVWECEARDAARLAPIVAGIAARAKLPARKAARAGTGL